jgi:ABC-type bacteriocin/lantibiotic exporter with double-glycine peptidase domain
MQNHGRLNYLMRLNSILMFQKGDILKVAIFAFAVAVLSLVIPIAVENLVNTVAFGVLLWPLLVIEGILVVCLALAASIKAMQVYLVEIMQRRLFVNTVDKLSAHFPYVNLDEMDNHLGSSIAYRFLEISTLQKSMASLLLDALGIIISSIVGMVVLAFYHPFLLGFDLFLISVCSTLFLLLGWGGVRSSIKESHEKYEMADWLESLLGSPKAIRLHADANFPAQKSNLLLFNYLSSRKSHFQVVWRQTLFSLGLQVVANALLLGLGGWLVINRQLTLGQLVAGEIIVTLIVASLAKFGKYAEIFYDLITSAEKLGMLSDLPVQKKGGSELKKTLAGIDVRIIQPVLKQDKQLSGKDVHFLHSERAAIVGPDANSLFEMISGLRSPKDIHIELDGIDVRGIAMHNLDGQIGLISTPEIFPGTLFQNVSLGRQFVGDVEVRDALDKVGFLKKAMSMPNGLESVIGKGSLVITPQEEILLTIARVIAGKPRLLLVDKIVDLLDFDSRKRILSELVNPLSRWTLLVSSNNPEVVASFERKEEIIFLKR